MSTDVAARRAPVLIDCDPGHDDALAILLAATHLNLVGITTVFGNQSVERTTRNALAFCRLARLDLPVAKGAAGPLRGAAFDGSDLHGGTGLDGAELPEPDREPVGLDAVAFTAGLLGSAAAPLAVIAVGPLTNIATLLLRHPQASRAIASISIMGGTTGIGNVTAVAENNIFADPEAADIVFRSGIPIHMVGLNVTTTVGAGEDDIAALRQSGGPVARVVADLLAFYRERQIRVYGRTIAPFHDPCAVLPLIRPELIEYREAHVAIELDGRVTRGMTVCDFRGIAASGLSHVRPSAPANTRVAITARSRAVTDLVISTITDWDRRLVQ